MMASTRPLAQSQPASADDAPQSLCRLPDRQGASQLSLSEAVRAPPERLTGRAGEVHGPAMLGPFDKRRDMVRFLAIIETGSMSQAAKKLDDVGQPGLSRVIARIERDAGMPLFDRRKGRLTLTPFGTIVAEESRRLLDEIEAAEARIRSARDAVFRSGGE